MPHIYITQEPSDVCDVRLQKGIQTYHVCFFAKKYVVREVLYDFGDDHETTTKGFVW